LYCKKQNLFYINISILFLASFWVNLLVTLKRHLVRLYWLRTNVKYLYIPQWANKLKFYLSLHAYVKVSSHISKLHSFIPNVLTNFFILFPIYLNLLCFMPPCYHFHCYVDVFWCQIQLVDVFVRSNHCHQVL